MFQLGENQGLSLCSIGIRRRITMEYSLVLAMWLELGLPEDWFEEVTFLGSLCFIHIAMVDICVYRFTYVQVYREMVTGYFGSSQSPLPKLSCC